MEFLNRMKFISFLNNNKFFILFLLFGLLIFTYPMLISGFDLMPGDGTDVKTFNYLLEHSRLWLLRVKPHEYLWDAPFYYPYSNTLAYSDALIGLMPIYWIIRLFWSEQSSLQVLFITMCVLNYSTFYYFLNSKKCKLMFSSLASSLAAFIFAFGLMRYYRMSHLNYYSQFFTILFLIFLFKTDKSNSKFKNNLYFLLALIFLSLQFYSCYTLAFYFCIISIFMFVGFLFFKTSREFIFEYLKRFYAYLIFYIIFLLITLIPLAVHYLAVENPRNIESVLYHIQNSFVWIRNLSVLDNLFIKDIFEIDYFLKHETSASLGIFTTIFALIGIYKMKNIKWVFYITCFLIFLMSCTIFDYTIWNFLFYIIPGAQGIRVVLRISFIALIILCMALAAFVDYYLKINKKSSKIILISAIILITLEQIPLLKYPKSDWQTYNWSKSVFERQIKQSARLIDNNFKIIKFEIIPKISISEYPNPKEQYKMYELAHVIENLAMWTALKKNMYTVNGITGIFRNTKHNNWNKMYVRPYYVDIKEFDNERYLLENKKSGIKNL